jgi:hypothetical protein
MNQYTAPTMIDAQMAGIPAARSGGSCRRLVQTWSVLDPQSLAVTRKAGQLQPLAADLRHSPVADRRAYTNRLHETSAQYGIKRLVTPK